jgi:hypothetical protein
MPWYNSASKSRANRFVERSGKDVLMAALATVKILVEVIDSTGVVIERDLLPVRFAPGAGVSGLLETIVLAPGNNTIAIPTGRKMLLLEIPPSAVSLTMKGANGDTGTTIVPASNGIGLPNLISLGASPTLVINNGGSSVTCQGTFL